MRSILAYSAICCVFALALSRESILSAEDILSLPATRPIEPQEMISLQFPPNLELKVLIQYVGTRLGINFLYDEQAVSQRITIVSPVKIPKESLLGLLESTLKMKGLLVVDSDQPGWKRILPANGIASVTPPTTQPWQAQGKPAAAVTQIFVLQFADPQKADSVIRPFLTQPGGNCIAISDQHLLIVSDFASTVEHVAALVRLVDKPPPDVATRFLSVKNLDVSVLAPQLQQILAARDRSQAIPGAGNNSPGIEVLQDSRTNQIILVGTPDKVTSAETVAASLDVALQLETKVYSLRSVSPDRLDHLVRELIDPLDAKRLYQSAVDKESGWLVAIAVVVIAAGWAGILRTTRGRWVWDSLLLHLPFIGTLISKSAVVRIAIVVETLLQSGVMFVQAIRVAAKSTHNVLLQDALFRCEAAVSAGRDIAPALQASQVFPPLVVQVFSVGQESGRLEEMLGRLAKDYDEQVASAAQRFTSLLEPILILMLAAIVATIALATMLPILEASDVLG